MQPASHVPEGDGEHPTENAEGNVEDHRDDKRSNTARITRRSAAPHYSGPEGATPGYVLALASVLLHKDKVTAIQDRTDENEDGYSNRVHRGWDLFVISVDRAGGQLV